MDSSLRWISVEVLKDRWKMNDFEIAKILLQFDIKAHDLYDHTEISINAINDYLYNTFDETPAYIEDNYYTIACVIKKLPYLMFTLNYIELFEKEQLNKDNTNHQTDGEVEIKYRPTQIHRARCRAITESIWKYHPDTTIADLAIHDDITGIACEGKLYAEKTIRDWVKDLCPNRDPGRRPKPE
jgi:hypothetical protein